MMDCCYCGRKGHRESKCLKKKVDSDKSGSGKAKHGNQHRSHCVEGLGGAGMGPTFVMKHKANSLKISTLMPNKVWYVDSGASNQWRTMKNSSPISKSRNSRGLLKLVTTPLIQLSTSDRPARSCTIAKNLVLVAQIVDQWMQVRFTHLGCFIEEEEGHIIVQGRLEGRMFIREMNGVGTTMFSKGQKVELDID